MDNHIQISLYVTLGKRNVELYGCIYMVLIWRMNDHDWIIIMKMITWFNMDSNVICIDGSESTGSWWDGLCNGIFMVYYGVLIWFCQSPEICCSTWAWFFFLGGFIWFQWDVSSFHQPTCQHGISPTQARWENGWMKIRKCSSTVVLACSNPVLLPFTALLQGWTSPSPKHDWDCQTTLDSGV